MKKTHVYITGGLTAVALVAAVATSPVQAQRQRVPGQNRQQRMQQWQNMTPEQREQMQQQMQQRQEERQETQMTQALTGLGVTDQAQQNAVIEFMRAQKKARQPLQELQRKLQEDMADKDATDDEISDDLKDLSNAITAEKKRSDAAEKDLDAKIGYTKNPRLEATLRMYGLLGDDAAYTGAGGMGGRMGGRGGRGGGMGGPGGGGPGGGQRGGGQGGAPAPAPAAPAADNAPA